jgi:methionyl-tRNA formyltransferase
MKIIFLGTPDFAVASLSALVDAGYNIVAVITAPDKHAKRGMQLQQSAVKQFAVSKNIPVLQPEKLKAPAFLEELKSLQADLQIVVAFRMLPEVVWNMPPLGTINVHASLLPQYRGAAPINWAIIHGEKETGVTTFKLRQEIDTGDILLQQKIAIEEEDNAGILHDKLMHAGAKLLLQTIQQLQENKLEAKAQSLLNDTKHAPKIFTETCNINWNDTVENCYNFIRGLSPYPAAFTTLQEKKIKIFACKKIVETHTLPCGTYNTDYKTYLRYACSNGFIDILQMQLEGKSKMGVGDFLRGFKK